MKRASGLAHHTKFSSRISPFLQRQVSRNSGIGRIVGGIVSLVCAGFAFIDTVMTGLLGAFFESGFFSASSLFLLIVTGALAILGGILIKTGQERKKLVREALERVGLGERMKHRPNQLSGGQQQRCAIARALAVKPSLILADEPTGNLDSKTGREIMAMFKELHEAGNTIVLITHDNKVAQCAERVIRIEDGKLYENQEVPDDDAVPVV